MKSLIKYSLFPFLFALVVYQAQGQDNIFEDMLEEEVEVENPVYMPVLGFGGGMMSFYGDMAGNRNNLLAGTPAIKANISTFLDPQHYSKLNVFFNVGNLKGEDKQLFYDLARQNNPEQEPYYNFQTSVQSLGLNVDYGFGNFFPSGEKKVRPFVAVGVEAFFFSTNTNKGDGTNEYQPWDKGLVANHSPGEILRPGETVSFQQDNDYEETVVKTSSGNVSFNLPSVDAGIDYYLSDRAKVRFGASFHFANTDFLDGVDNSSGSYLKNDKYMMSYATFHYDLWSDDETITVEKYFLEMDAEDFAELAADEDYDNVLDFGDECPGTPFGVEVDTLGCPYDDDGDGVPNYMDEEANTPAGAFVDDKGMAIEASELANYLQKTENAVPRSDVYDYMLSWSRYNRSETAGLDIPEKFKPIDVDNDGYISFEELLKAIDNFFDFNSDFTTADIYELNDFFFAQ
jgi:hypothetical protein